MAGLAVTAVLVAGVAGLAALAQQRAEKEAAELYHTANSLFDTEQYTPAEELYLELRGRRAGAPYAAEVSYRLARLLEATERYGEAAEWWARVAADPAGVAADEIAYHQGVCAARMGDADAARRYFEQVRATRPNGAAARAALNLGRLAEARGDGEAAQQFYESAVLESPDRDTVLAAGAALREINLAAFRNRRGEDAGLTTHLVRTGDTLQAIAERYRSTVELIMEVNGIDDPSRLRVNQRLVVPQTDFAIVINKSRFTLTLYDGDRIFAVYPVGLGKDGCTPVGRFEVKEKIKDPTWWSPRGPIPPGDPENELGTRWIGMRALDPGIGEGYGIHATIRPSTIGTEASNGCPRMYEEDAQELFRLVRVGTPVRVDPA